MIWSRITIPMPRPRGQRLGLGHVAEVVVGELVGQLAGQLFVRWPSGGGRWSRRTSPGSARRVDVRVVHDAHANLRGVARVVHPLQEGKHHPPKPLHLGTIDRACRWRRRGRRGGRSGRPVRAGLRPGGLGRQRAARHGGDQRERGRPARAPATRCLDSRVKCSRRLPPEDRGFNCRASGARAIRPGNTRRTRGERARTTTFPYAPNTGVVGLTGYQVTHLPG